MTMHPKQVWINIRSRIKSKHTWLYFLLFSIPWYRITTVFLLIQVFYLKMNIQELDAENRRLFQVNTSLITNQIYSTKILDKIKIPIWCKLKRGNQYTMQFYNQAFAEKYALPHGITRRDYYGNTDFALFPYSAARLFHIGDSLTALSDVQLFFDEDFKDRGNQDFDIEVQKWKEVNEDKDTLIWGAEIPKMKKKLK